MFCSKNKAKTLLGTPSEYLGKGCMRDQHPSLPPNLLLRCVSDIYGLRAGFRSSTESLEVFVRQFVLLPRRSSVRSSAEMFVSSFICRDVRQFVLLLRRSFTVYTEVTCASPVLAPLPLSRTSLDVCICLPRDSRSSSASAYLEDLALRQHLLSSRTWLVVSLPQGPCLTSSSSESLKGCHARHLEYPA